MIETKWGNFKDFDAWFHGLEKWQRDEHKREVEEHRANQVPDSWYMVPALAPWLADHGIETVTKLGDGYLIIRPVFEKQRYLKPDPCKDIRDKWFEFSDNGGEINISLINAPDETRLHPRNFISIPTTSFDYSLSIETMMYRICAWFKGEEIDYQFTSEPYIHILQESRNEQKA